MDIRQTCSLFCFHAVLHAEATLTQNTVDLYKRGDGRGTEVLVDSSPRLRKNKSELFPLSFETLCQAVECGRSRMQMNGGKRAMRPEADVGSVTVHDADPDSELPLTSFNVNHPGLAAVRVGNYALATDFTPRPQREK